MILIRLGYDRDSEFTCLRTLVFGLVFKLVFVGFFFKLIEAQQNVYKNNFKNIKIPPLISIANQVLFLYNLLLLTLRFSR